MATAAQRQHAHSLMLWLIAHEPQIHYQQRRPMTLTGYTEQQLADLFARHGTVHSDCSETVTALCKWAGLASPTGSYNGYGNSSSMYANLLQYLDPSAAKVGAIVVFGPQGADHAAMVMEAGHDPWLFSHGQEKGPLKVRFSAEKAAHRGPATFLSVAEL